MAATQFWNKINLPSSVKLRLPSTVVTLGASTVSLAIAFSLLIYDHSDIPRSPATKVEQQQSEKSEPAILFGVVPQSKPEDIYDRWSAIATHLSTRLDRPVRIVASMTIPEFEKNCLKQKFDFVYCNPWHQAALAEDNLYRPIACVSNKKLEGIIVAGPNVSSIESGHAVAFPSPHAFAASMLTQQHLEQIGTEYSPEYVNTHDSVYRSVADGLFRYGGGVAATFNKMPKETQSQLQIIWKSEPYAPHPICVSSKTSQTLADRMQELLLELAGDSHELASAGLSKLTATKVDEYQTLTTLFPSALFQMGETKLLKQPDPLLKQPDPEHAKEVYQIGALPYRIDKDGTVEVLLVKTNSKSKTHWTIPKGTRTDTNIDSPAEIAELEAFHDAGIHGIANPKIIGNYSYERNERTFHVAVHQVRVTEELDEWPEDSRERKWYTAADAANTVKHQTLSNILADFSVGT